MDTKSPSQPKRDPWLQLRGVLKDVFEELGGGESYLSAERGDFEPRDESE